MKIIQTQLLILLLQLVIIWIFAHGNVATGFAAIITLCAQILYCIIAAVLSREDPVDGKVQTKHYIISAILIAVIGFPGCAIILF